MLKKLLGACGLAALSVWAASAQDAGAIIDTASKALGVDTLRTVQYSATGSDFTLGQAGNPNLPWPRFINKSYSRSINFVTRASHVDRIRLQGENPPRGGGNQPVMGEQQQTQTIVIGPDTPWAQQLELWMMPHGFLRAAAARTATVESRTTGGKRYNVVTFVGDNKAKVNGYINAENLVEKVETWIDDAFLGDVLFEASYTDYKTVGGVQFPMHIVQRQGGHPILDLRVADVQVNAAIDIKAPQGQGAAAAPAAAASSEKLGDGVYLITGGYAVIAVDFKDHIAIVESGQSEARGLAVIAEAKRLIPNKPIRYLLNTHSHIDHSRGLRAFVAEGTTIVTHQVNKAYLERVLSQPHTLNPDRAQQVGKKPVVEGVGDKRVFTDGNRIIELHHLKNFGHHDGMLVAYLPKERVLLQGDGYNPQAANAKPLNPPSPYTLSLLDNIQRLKLDVERVVPVHYPADNRVVTLAEIMRWVGRPGSAD